MILLPTPRSIVFSSGRCASDAVVDQRIGPATGHPQGYVLRISADSISIFADDDAGAFYARQTLLQLRRQVPESLPCCTIEDWPDFPARGFMLDISRDKVPTIASLMELIDLLAELKINQLQLYTEHTFAYRKHETVWRDASPMTPDEIRALDAYCRARFIDLVPNQNSFGHLERWLKHPEYRDLAECPDGFVFPWGKRMDSGFSLDPNDPRSLALIEELFDELLPNFGGRLFNVGCDETFDIGLGKSKAQVETRGRERVYLGFLNKIHAAVRARGRTMMFWGDIILHKPELLDELARSEIIALNWGYEANHPFERETAAFAKAGVPFYVCPGTSSWCSIAGRTENAIANLRSAAEQGLRNGAIGYLITDWGDYGHLQYLPVSYPGIAAGAAFSWCEDSNRALSIEDALDAHVFNDASGVMGRLVADLGRVHSAIGKQIANGTPLFWALIDDPDHRKQYESVTIAELRACQQLIDRAIAPLGGSRVNRPDAELVRAEFRNAAAILRCACDLGIRRLDPSAVDRGSTDRRLSQAIAEHRRLWLARNRVGGLEDSVARLSSRLGG